MLNDSHSLIIKTNRLEADAYIPRTDVTGTYLFTFAHFFLLCIYQKRKVMKLGKMALTRSSLICQSTQRLSFVRHATFC